MKSLIIIALVFALAFTQSTIQSNEKLCGSYRSTCKAEEAGSIKYALQLIGVEGQDPASMDLSSTHYDNSKCSSQHNLYSVRLVSVIDAMNTIEKTYSIRVTNALFTMTESGLEKYICDAAVVAGEEYSVKQYHCVDEKGMELFDSYRKQIGKTRKVDFTFDRSTVTLDLDEVITFNQFSDEGCTSPTVAPTTPAPTTPAPTTPAPTTSAPTTPAPTTPAPTTPAPTTPAPTTPAPTTPAPTTQPPTTQPPTTQPPTPAPTTHPTPAPTTPPTPAPTEKPTEKPKSVVGWFVGGAIAILIGFAIIFYIVIKKNKRDEEEEMKPLV